MRRGGRRGADQTPDLLRTGAAPTWPTVTPSDRAARKPTRWARPPGLCTAASRRRLADCVLTTTDHGCLRPRAEPTAATGRRPSCCNDVSHDRKSARRERERLRGEGWLPDVDPGQRPVAMASATLDGAAESLTGRVAELWELCDRVEAAAATMADQTAVDLELDAIRAAADLDLARQRAEGFATQQQAGAQIAASEQQSATATARAEALAGELELVRGEAADQADQLAELAGELQSTQEDRDQRLRALSE